MTLLLLNPVKEIYGVYRTGRDGRATGGILFKGSFDACIRYRQGNQ